MNEGNSLFPRDLDDAVRLTEHFICNAAFILWLLTILIKLRDRPGTKQWQEVNQTEQKSQQNNQL